MNIRNVNFKITISKRKIAFTLSEILITLGIIGVVAAITIPNVVTKYQKKSTAIQLKKTYSDLQNAIKLSEIDNESMNNWNYPGGTANNDARTTFIKQYLQPYFKNSNIRSYYGYTYYKNMPSLILSDGRILSFYFGGVGSYNWIFVDLNGKKGPNIAGKDIFVMDIGYNRDYNPQGRLIFWAATCGNKMNCLTGTTWSYGCNKKHPNPDIYENYFCGKVIQLNNWEIPDNYPW